MATMQGSRPVQHITEVMVRKSFEKVVGSHQGPGGRLYYLIKKRTPLSCRWFGMAAGSQVGQTNLFCSTVIVCTPVQGESWLIMIH